MIKIYQENRFKKDIKLMKKRNKNLSSLMKIIELIANGDALPRKYKDHKLTGNWVDFRECHIEPDWLLIYKITEKELILVRTGTHSDLF